MRGSARFGASHRGRGKSRNGRESIGPPSDSGIRRSRDLRALQVEKKELALGGDVELEIDVPPVILDSAKRDAKAFGNARGRMALEDEADDLALAWAEGRPVFRVENRRCGGSAGGRLLIGAALDLAPALAVLGVQRIEDGKEARYMGDFAR